jgi:SulP family sulfate permease
VLTETFHFIPQAALSAVIWVALLNLIDVSEFWKAWKHSKKDFWAMLITFILTLVYNTGI